MSTAKSNKIDSLTTSHLFSQIISDPTQVLPNYSFSTNLIVTGIGVRSLLYRNYHHQIVFAKVSLKIKYTPLYELSIWDYKNANEQLIIRAIESFN